jgi:carbamoyltransferase
MNTSFNISGEPIVETPEDAIASFKKMDIDYLVIGNYLLWN